MKERILRHLKDFGSITSWDAILEYGCTRLSQYIYLLKKDGYHFEYETIKSKNRYGEPNHCKRYILLNEVQNV